MLLVFSSLGNVWYYLVVIQVLWRNQALPSCIGLHIHAHKNTAPLPLGSMKSHRGPLGFIFFDPFHSQSIIRDCPPNCNQNENSNALLTHDCEQWMEMIVPLSFVFYVQPPFVSLACQITALPRISKTFPFLLECR